MQGRRKRLIAWSVGLPIGLVLIVAATGCSRRHYRLRADRDARHLIAETSIDSRWGMPDFNPYPDPRSRFYDVSDPDRPRMPYDDPDSHRFMRVVFHMKNYRGWRPNSDMVTPENPEWLSLLPTYVSMTPSGQMLLDLHSAVMIARINSAGYQDTLEDIYLSALDVSFERFQFQVQKFGGINSSIYSQGNEPQPVIGATGPGVGNSTTLLDQRENLEARRQFAAGGQLIVGVANSIVWDFAHPNTNFATSLLNFSLVQPLLRNGTKQFILTRLTLAERQLLANLRAMQRYRESFYLNVAYGAAIQNGVLRLGGFQGGAGLTGFSGIGLGGFGGVGADVGVNGFGARGAGGSGTGSGVGLAGGGEGTVGGFFGLVQTMQAIRNTRSALDAQLRTLGLLEALFDSGAIGLVQVDQFRQNIETERANLLRGTVNFENSVELFQIQTLGVPSTLSFKVDDSILKPFQLTSQHIQDMQNAAVAVQDEIGNLTTPPIPAELIRLTQKLGDLIRGAHGDFEPLRIDVEKLIVDAPDLARRQESDGARLKQDLEQVRRNLADLRDRFQEDYLDLERIREATAAGQLLPAADRLIGLSRQFVGQLQELALMQARAKLERVGVDRVELSFEEAIFIARECRLDWMNARAALVDQWRLIDFNANRLKAGLNVEITGNMGTVGNNPASFQGAAGNLRGRVMFDAPLNRLGERNQYRQSLIDYQQAKRDYIFYVDGLTLSLRVRLREINRLRTNLEIQRRAITIAIRRVDQTLDELNEPTSPSAPGQAQQTLSPTLAQNLLGALADYRNTQDNFISVWLNYQRAYAQLFYELGIMDLDDEGMWNRETLQDAIDRAMSRCLALRGAKVHPFIQSLDSCGALDGHVEKLLDVQPLDVAIADPEEWLKSDLTLALTANDAKQSSSSTAPSPTSSPTPSPAGPPEKPTDEPPPLEPNGDLLQRWLKRRSPAERPVNVTKEEFIVNLHRVHEAKQRQLTLPDMLKETGIPESHIKAYESVLEQNTLDMRLSIPARPVDDVPDLKPVPQNATPAAVEKPSQAAIDGAHEDLPEEVETN